MGGEKKTQMQGAKSQGAAPQSGRVQARSKKPELLAPAGGFEQLEYALYFGADAVYVGGRRFGLRVRADNFSDADLLRVASMVHAAGKKLFVTVNAFVRDDELDELRAYIRLLGQAGVDAVILTDLATLRVVREEAPELAIHVSTQASCTNTLAARTWYELGARRIVLARELSLVQIAALRKQVPEDLELEVFVHGAMCMAYSGRCLISNHLTGRDANRGHCTQPCRWTYHLQEEKRPGEYFPIETDDKGSFIMSSKDLMMLDHLDELMAAGVDSIKIEGRVKGAYYVATVINAYRQVLDGAPAAAFLSELDAVSHRPYHTGFFYGEAEQAIDGAEYSQTHDLVATVLSCDTIEACGSEGCMTSYIISVEQRNRFFEGDTLEVLSPGHPVRPLPVRSLRTEYGQLTDAANQTCNVYRFESSYPLHPRDILRRPRGDAQVKG